MDRFVERFRNVLVVLALVLAQSSAAAAQAFYDSEFAEGDWSAVKVTDGSPGQTGTLTAQQVMSGGNPDAYRLVRNDWTGPGSVHFVHFKAGAEYTPATQGVLVSVTFDIDAREIASSALSIQIVLRQNGSYYFATNNITTGESWVHFHNAGMFQNDFDNRGGFGAGGPVPDFSSTGSAIEFGFSAGGGSASTNPVFLRAGIDNWAITLETVPVATARQPWSAIKELYR